MSARACLRWIGLLLALGASTASALAHPLGNFTINHLAHVRVSRGELRVRYVLDIAEIPTFQLFRGKTPSKTWADSESALVLRGVHVDVDGRPITLVARGDRAALRPGAGGLSTLYWLGEFSAPIASGAHDVRIQDDVYADRRIGWRDIVVEPQREPTHELTAYPNALLGSPRHVDAIAFRILPSGMATAPSTIETQPDRSAAPSLVRSNALSDLFSQPNQAPPFVLLTVLAAFGLGALHALEPGHGKALLAFTLVGSRATVKQATILAASLTFAHTIGVVILGLVLFSAADFVSESIYPWITLLSGLVIACIGARNLARYAHARQHAHNANHHHGDGDVHHSHEVAGTGPIGLRSAVAAAMSGGIAPCPAAIVVLLAALRLHQLAYGMVLIVIFSLGLASVLTGLGVAVVHGSAWIARSGRFDALVSAGPLISAALISLVGAVMLGEGFAAQGVGTPPWAIAALAVLAIVGYAAAQQHQHRERSA